MSEEFNLHRGPTDLEYAISDVLIGSVVAGAEAVFNNIEDRWEVAAAGIIAAAVMATGEVDPELPHLITAVLVNEGFGRKPSERVPQGAP